jgi:hypothetical protein
MKKDSRSYEWSKQRKKLGFDDRKLWSLDHTIAEFVLPRLIRFREVKCGYPGNLTEKKWNKILDQMIYSMKVVCAMNAIPLIFLQNFYGGKIQIEEEKKINRGLYLFGKYFRDL